MLTRRVLYSVFQKGAWSCLAQDIDVKTRRSFFCAWRLCLDNVGAKIRKTIGMMHNQLSLVALFVLANMAFSAHAAALNQSYEPAAVASYKVKADAGNAQDQYFYARALLFGWGVKKDTAKAMEYARRAVDQGYERALRLVANGYEEGWLGETNLARAAVCHANFVRFAQKQAEAGDASAMCLLGAAYCAGQGVAQDQELSWQWFCRAATNDDAVALFLVGRSYANGKGVPKDLARAVAMMERSAELGYPDAMGFLGQAYLHGGWAVEKNPERGFAWCEKAARIGVVEAMMNLGLAYEHGIRANASLAVSWYRKAAEKEDPEALCRLGLLYCHGGLGLQTNYVKGVGCLRQAAEKGHVEAMFFMGDAYRLGWVSDSDGTAAFAWYLRSAEAGDKDAMYVVALYYADGKFGFQSDRELSLLWLRKAAEAGNERALRKLDEMQKREK